MYFEIDENKLINEDEDFFYKGIKLPNDFEFCLNIIDLDIIYAKYNQIADNGKTYIENEILSIKYKEIELIDFLYYKTNCENINEYLNE